MTVSTTSRQSDWRRRRRDIDPLLRWVRDDERLYVVIPRHGHCIELSGAEALLFELWADGSGLEHALEFLACSHGLTATQSWDLFARLLARITERGGLHADVECDGDG